MGLFLDLAAAEAAHHVLYRGRRHHGDLGHELIGGAAGFEAMRMYEHDREREGIVGHHDLGKELIAGFAAAEAMKLIDERKLNRVDRDRAERHAIAQAEHLYEQRAGGRPRRTRPPAGPGPYDSALFRCGPDRARRAAADVGFGRSCG
jgi:Protein of unknown function (DUF3759)